MARPTLQQIAVLLETHNALTNRLAIAAAGDDATMWQYLVSNDLWGGSGSIADQALIEHPRARTDLQALLIQLGRAQIDLDRANPRTEMWVRAFEAMRTESR